MADAYMKVKDNGASGLELVREPVEDAQETLGVDSLKNAFDEVTGPSDNLNTTGEGRFYVSGSGVIKTSTTAYLGMTDLIPCKPNTKYTACVFGVTVSNDANYFFCAWYDNNKTFLSRDNTDGQRTSVLTHTFTSPADAKYLFFDVTNSSGIAIDSDSHIAIVEGETPLSAYIPPITASDYQARKTASENAAEIAQAQQDIEDAQEDIDDIRTVTANINTTTDGRNYVKSSGQIVIGYQGLTYFGIGAMIPCKPDTDYTMSMHNAVVNTDRTEAFIAWYDSSETFIQRDSANNIPRSALYHTFHSPQDAKYLFCDFYNNGPQITTSDYSHIAIVEGSTPMNPYAAPVTADDSMARNMAYGNEARIEALESDTSDIHDAIDVIEAEIFNKYPSYYDANVAAAISTIKANMGVVGCNGESFVFITDPHWGINTKHSPAIIEHILKNTNLRTVVCGGDVLDSGDKADEIAKGYEFMNAFYFVPDGLKYVMGNHDGNHNQHSSSQSSYWLSSEEIYSLFYAEAGKDLEDVHSTTGKLSEPTIYCYFDVPGSKTRFLNIGSPFGKISNDEITWITTQLANNPGLNFVILAHYLYDSDYTDNALAMINAVKDFSNVKAIIYGHIHMDVVDYTDTGIPIVATDTDARARLSPNNPNTATIGTITEQAFDNITINFTNNDVLCARVGRGKNRIIKGGVITVSTTETLTSDVSSPTWDTSDPSVATVSGGVVTAVGSGSCIITAEGTADIEYWYITVA